MRFLKKEQKTHIDMIPLLDSIFILLIFFSVMLINANMSKKLTLPLASEGEAVSGNEVVVEVRGNGICVVNGSEYDTDSLSDTGIMTEDSVVLRADVNVKFGDVAEALDRLAAMGIKDVGIEIREKSP